MGIFPTYRGFTPGGLGLRDGLIRSIEGKPRAEGSTGTRELSNQ